MKSFFKLSSDQWNTFFSGIQALCVVVGTLLALYGIFFTTLPEKIVAQLRTDVSDAREQLVDLRKERRTLEADLNNLQGKLTEAQAQVEAKTRELTILEDKSASLSGQMRKILGERGKYFGSIYQFVLEDFVRSIRARIYDLRQSALQARELVKYKTWLEDGRHAFGPADQRPGARASMKAIDQWAAWRKNEPEIWLYTHLDQEWRSRILDQEHNNSLQTDLEEHQRYLDDFERAVSGPGSAATIGSSVIDGAISAAHLERLTEQDRDVFTRRISKFLEPERTALAEPLSISLPAGSTDADVVSRGEAVLGRLERFEVLVNALDQQLSSHD